MDEMKDPITLDFTATQAPAEDAPVGQKALDSERPPVRVVLLALDQGKFDSQRSLDELAALAEANGMQAVATVCQKRSTPEAATLLGEGKVEEARLVCLNTDAEAAIFDGELTGSQIRNLSAALQVEVLDRTMLILEIFRARATTNEGKLQTELATLKYRMPRLQGLGEALSRQRRNGLLLRKPRFAQVDMHVDKPRHHVAPSEVYDPVGNAPGGHDTPPVDGKLPGRKTTAVINYGIGIKRFHLRKRKKIGQLKQLP